MAKANNNIVLTSFNCRSVKSSLEEVRDLCNISDIVFIQELHLLSDIHGNYLAYGMSAVNMSHEILVGRPYGGTVVLYRHDLGSFINTIETYDSRVTAIQFKSAIGPVLIMGVYMPTDYGDSDSFESYVETCARIKAVINDCDAVYTILLGDFNCQFGTRFYDTCAQLTAEINVKHSDCNRLNDVFTYCHVNHNGAATSSIDHCFCSPDTDQLICDINVLYEFVTSDHKP